MGHKFNVGVLGATGAVGQNYIDRLRNHPWFDVVYLAASASSAGKTYEEAVGSRWIMKRDIPENVRRMVVGDVGRINGPVGKCHFLFSAYEGGKEDIQKTEMFYAATGLPVVSNNSAHRWTEDVPIIIPEINPGHLSLIDVQRRNRGFKRGFVVTKPNCGELCWILPVYALIKAGYRPNQTIVSTEQSISGAGLGLPALNIDGNVIPYISGEEEKTEREPLKILRNLIIRTITLRIMLMWEIIPLITWN